MIRLTILAIIALGLSLTSIATPKSMLLNGEWEIGDNRDYDSTVMVPGIHKNPTQKNNGKLWYRKNITLPKGTWRMATLELKGARFRPEVYINGQLTSSAQGGMAATSHTLQNADMKPGNKITIEVALASLADVPPSDASYIPIADQWRSNNSSSLWDDVVLHFNNLSKIENVVIHPDIENKQITVDYTVTKLTSSAKSSGYGTLVVSDNNGRELIKKSINYTVDKLNKITIDYQGVLELWSPQTPNLYTMTFELDSKDSYTMPFGIKEFALKDKQFTLNGKPCSLRGSTIVWHRWVRDAEARQIAYDTTWLRENVVMRLKDHGANLLRFHLGVPPQRVLDLCDRYGLLVQYEWSFFHGMPASEESCLNQYSSWLSSAVKHPSIALYHPYNETEGDQLNIVWRALDSLLPKYPKLVVSERDVIHLHKYWWSIFENVGLFYDNFQQFDKAIVVDEFGGNYLDGYGRAGGYVTLKETFLRFLGRNQTPEQRLKLQDYSHGKIAEYWRRVGAAGIAPFPIASSWEDGNNWFLGDVRDGKPKAVWNSLTCAWSPVTVSAEIWDKNFTPQQQFTFPLWFFNETDTKRNLDVRVSIEDSNKKIYSQQMVSLSLDPYSRATLPHTVVMPDKEGEFVVKAELCNRPDGVKYPVVSQWDVRTFQPKVSKSLTTAKVYIPSYEDELNTFAKENNLQTTLDFSQAEVMLFSRKTWDKIALGDSATSDLIKESINKGRSVLMLDTGDIDLGQGYPEQKDDVGPLQWVAKVEKPKIKEYNLFSGIKLVYSQAAEPESFLFPSSESCALWSNIPQSHSGLWNGYRGGLVVPAYDMSVVGLNPHSLLEMWTSRGADKQAMTSGGEYYAYELYGFYAFSTDKSDKSIEAQLKERVRFLIEDAPALAVVMDPNTPATLIDLANEYKISQLGVAESLQVLAGAGKNLTKSPLLQINFGKDKGRLIISQMLTQGRLAQGVSAQGVYDVRYDPTAVQLVLNMIERLTANNK